MYSNISVHVAPGGAENTRWDTYRRQLCLRRNYRHFFGWWFSEVSGIQTEGSERLDVEALEKCPCPAACASLWRLPRLFGDDTHAVDTRPRWAREHGIHILRGSLCRWVASLVASLAHRQVLEQGRGQK